MLTDTQIRNLKPAEKAKKYADGGGLYLYVAKTGSKLWRMAYRFNDKEKLLSFGEYPIVSLKDARTKRNEAKKLLADGIDPSRHKKEMKNAALLAEANTFEHVVREWHETQTIHNSPKDRKRKLSTFELHLFPTLKRKPISEVTAQDLLLILKPLERKGKELIAHRIIQYCGMVFRYAVATGRVTRNIAADLRGAIRPHQGRHRATIVSAEKIGVLLNRLDNYHGHFQVRCALRLFPLLFVRSAELVRAEWSEFNLETREWHIPAERMKMRRPHLVPLARQVVGMFRVLHAITGNRELVFPGTASVTRCISDVGLLNALRRLGYGRDEMTVHGFRSMASTRLNEMGYRPDVIEAQLAHAEKNSVRDAYNRAQYVEERRRMMQEWADYLDRLRDGEGA